MKKKIFLLAYMNTNLGDDLFLDIICKRYPDMQFYIHCPSDAWRKFRPGSNLKNIHFWRAEAAIKTIFKDGAFGRFVRKCIFYVSTQRMRRLQKNCYAVVKIGGSVFMEKRTDDKNPIALTEIEPLAGGSYKEQKPPRFLIGANVGPVYTVDYLHAVAEELTSYRSVVLRDKASYRLYQNFPSVQYAPDVVFQYSVRAGQIEESKKQVFLAPIALENRGLDEEDVIGYYDKMAELCRYYIDFGYEMVLASFCKAEGDMAAIEKICGRLSDKDRLNIRILSYEGDEAPILTEMAKSEFLVCCRFHSAVLSLLLNKPIYPISYGDKMSNLLADLAYEGHWTTVDKWKDTPIADVDYNRRHANITNVETFKRESQRQFAPLDTYIKEAKA